MNSRMASGSYIVSPAQPDDAEGIYDMMRATWLDTYPNEAHGISREDIRARIEGEHGELVAKKIEKWRKTIENPSRKIFVAKDGDKIVGYVAPFYDETEKHYRVGGLYVLPEAQGKGVGYKLIHESIASIGREHDIYLHVVTYNRKAISFYERQGFVKTGRDTTGSTRGLKDGRLIPEIEMVLRATMKDNNPWKTLLSKTVYQNPWMRVREDTVVRPDGSDGIYGVMESRDSVIVVVLNENNEVYLIRSFNYPVSTWSWGLPGGGGDDEEPEAASKRELAEETGITASSWTFLGKTRVSSGLMTEKMAVYLAQDLSFGERLSADDTELINDGKFVSFDEIDKMIDKNEIDDAQTVTGLYLALRWLDHRSKR